MRSIQLVEFSAKPEEKRGKSESDHSKDEKENIVSIKVNTLITTFFYWSNRRSYITMFITKSSRVPSSATVVDGDETLYHCKSILSVDLAEDLSRVVSFLFAIIRCLSVR